jgi:hypothetical protein
MKKNEREKGRRGSYLLGPALERRPAIDAVAIIEPDGEGLEGEVWSMAFAACLVATKTLHVRFVGSQSGMVSRMGFTSCIIRSHGGRKKEQEEEEEEEKKKNPYLSTFVLIVFIKSSLSISRKE